MNAQNITGKREQVRNGSRRWWDKIMDDAVNQARENVDHVADLLQQRYGYTRLKAKVEADRLLDQYDHQVYEVIRRMPGDMVPKVVRYPWASLATVLGLGLLVGFMVKPNRCS